MARRIQLRRDTAAAWTASNPVLAQGEIGIDLTNNKLKIGNGTSTWNSLGYWDDKEPSGFDGTYNSLTDKPVIPDLANTGDIIPDGDNTRDLGSPARQWRHVYTAGGSIYLDNIKLTNVNGKFTATKVINPGEENEEPDPEDSDATSNINSEVYSIDFKAAALEGDHVAQISGTSEGLQIGTDANKSVIILTGDSSAQWSFDYTGVLTLPEGGDIVNSNGTSVLGGGGPGLGDFTIDGNTLQAQSVNIKGTEGVTIKAQNPLNPLATRDWSFTPQGRLVFPDGSQQTTAYTGQTGGGSTTIPSTVKGFINLVGDKPNNQDDIAFEAVVVRGNYAYALGQDYYINNSNNHSKVYKFDLTTGEQVWVKQIVAGRSAVFDVAIGEGQVVINGITQGGIGYKAGEEINFEGYQVGGSSPQNNFTIIADTVDEETGAVLTASVKPGYDVGAASYASTIQSYYESAQGDTCAIAYDDFNDKLIVVSEWTPGKGDAMDSFWQWANVYVMDPETGVINQTVTLKEDGDIYPNSIVTRNAAGGVAIVGEKYNEYRELGTLTLAAGYNGYFDILKTNLDPEYYPGAPFVNSSDFWITGTGITVQQNVDNVNYYPNLAAVTREGSGAQVTIGENGSGSYTLIGIAAGGTNYLPGHILRVLGTDLGGTTPENDALLQIITVDGSGGVTAAGISGSAFATAPVGGWTVSTVNYNVGSGAQFSITINPASGVYQYGGYNNGGSNYVPGDVLTIAGTNFAGGTSPANDVTVVVNSVSGSGEIWSIVNGEVTGTAPTDRLRINVDGVDFSVEGSWSMRQNLGGEAFVWTPAWTNAIGGPSGDRFYDACWSEDGSALYAVGRGRYETDYDQALVVKFDGATGAVVWGKDIKFTEAAGNNREARAVAVIPGSTDILVGGAWYNQSSGYNEIILTRVSDAGVAVWQKTYLMVSNYFENIYYINYELNIRASDDSMVVSFQQGTQNGNGLAYLKIDSTDGTVVQHRVISADGNSNYNYYNTPTANWADLYTNSDGDHIVMAGYTYVPTDNYYNALLINFPLNGYKELNPSERISIGEHTLTRYDVQVTTVTSAFDSFTPAEHVNTFEQAVDERDYAAIDPEGFLNVWTTKITNDAAGFLEFGDGSKQSFATNVIPQIPAANDYYLTEQDSGKHIFFEHENGWVYIPHWMDKNLPVGFTFTVVNTTGSNCYIECMNTTGPFNRDTLKLAGRNIQTYTIGIPDSGSGSMVTLLKIKEGYFMPNSDGDQYYPAIWMVSGPGDIYNND